MSDKAKSYKDRLREGAKESAKAKALLDRIVTPKELFKAFGSGPQTVTELLDCAKKAKAEAENRLSAIGTEVEKLDAERGVLVQRRDQALSIVQALEAASSLCGVGKV